MKPLLALLALALSLTTLPATANELTVEQIQSLKARLKALKDNLETHITSRNVSAGQAFAAAAADPRAAVELYLNCVKMVEYDREGRPEADFRAWREGQADRIKDPQFVTSLQQQLRYLTLSCQAAESEDKAQIFGALMSYVDSLSNLTEMPTGAVTQSVANSVFAKAYYLERLLGGAENWEPVPINVAGIYSRTIMPYLREKDPASLMNAWDKRIEQQARLVAMLEEKKDEELRGLNRDEERRARNNQSNQGGAIGEHSKEEFTQKTLPQLQWGKLKDMFQYVDQVNGAKAMLDFVEANLKHELGEQFYAEFEELITSAQGVGSARKPGTLAPGESNVPAQ
jgi:Txe/YoeB family toxin of Txe-Axe toxin-antitoxin module